MKINAIIYDLDGVIVNTEPIHYEAYRRAFETIGFSLTKDIYNLKLRSRGRKKGIPSVLTVTTEMLDKISHEKDKHFQSIINNEPIELFSDALKLIEVCTANNIPMAIGTASKQGSILIDKIGLKDRFKAIITSKDVANNKPSPDIYNICKERLGIVDNNAIVIEDSETGVIAALQAGLKVVYIKRPNAPMLTQKYLNNDNIYCYNNLEDFIIGFPIDTY